MDERSKALRDQYLEDPIVALDKPFEDSRGAIIPIVDEKMESCVLITSVKGTVRANHYHKTDWHFCYVMSGEIEYHWRETGDTSEPRQVTIKKGQCFFTPPMVDHAMVFAEDTTFMTLGRNPRDQETYEADIERIELVNPLFCALSADLNSRDDCRLCNSRDVIKVIELEPTPPANELLDASQLDVDQEKFPIDVYFCENCFHLQLLDVVSPERLFREYVYVSGTSPAFRQHFADYAKRVTEDYGLDLTSLIVEIGSNDGTLLRSFGGLGFERLLGIDPAMSIAEQATNSGIPTIPEFFTPELAGKLINDYGHAGLVVANNVCAHIDDLSAIVSGVNELLTEGGLFVIEVSYLKDVIEKTLFDTIYHEHLDYHTVRPLRTFLESNGFRVIDAYGVDSHGGSLRLVAMKGGDPDDVRASVQEMETRERQLGLYEASTFRAFSEKIAALGDQLVGLLDEIKSNDQTIAAFGLPAKATTLMHQFNINGSYVDYVVDDNPLKQEKYSPGFKIPIVSSEYLEKNTPDYVIVLAWNFADPIIKKLDWYLQAGGKVIVPLPEVRLVGI